MFSVNDVLTAAPDYNASFEGVVRVVAVSKDGNLAALFRLDTAVHQAPFNRETRELIEAIDQKQIVILDKFETNLPASKDQLSLSKQDRLVSTVELMTPTLGDDELILDAEYRGREFERIASAKKVNTRTIRRNFYSWLWGGMTDLAFIGPQKPKNERRSRQGINTARRGPKPSATECSKVPLPQVRTSLESGAKTFYQSGKFTQLEAYVETLKKYFSNGKRALKNCLGKTTLENLLLPPDELPTFPQFRYVCTELERELGKRESLPGEMKRKRQRSARRGKARSGVSGPGYRYEIDATKVQIRIVSCYHRRFLVKEATLYIIIDVWSGAYVGYALSLDNPSWALAAKALKNCFTDKGSVFSRLDLPYDASDWVSRHLPSRLAADRAEMVGNKAGVVPGLGIKVEIMPSMCPERKGTVEAAIGSVKHGHNYYKTPGKHRKNPGRRENDGKGKAAFTLYELEQLIVEILIDLNNDPVPLEHIPAEAIKGGQTAITHGGLFEWGLRNRTGFTRRLSEKEVFTNLLVQGTGRATPNGIHFKKNNFTSQDLWNSGLQQRAARTGAFDVEIRYDEHFFDEIWFLDEQTQTWKHATNDNPDVVRLKASLWEVEDFLRATTELTNAAKKENIHKKGEKANRINSTADNAIAEAKAAKKGLPKTQTKADIRQTTATELEIEHIKQAQEAVSSYASAISFSREQPIPIPDDEADDVQKSATSIGQRTLDLWRKPNGSLDK